MASTRDPASGVTAALGAMPAGTTRVEIMTDPQPGRTGTGAGCARQDGVALCTLVGTAEVETAEVEVVAFDAGGGTVLPVP